ncbi:hypothetical protein ACLB2K_052990 [Fragaria x ananassa]
MMAPVFSRVAWRCVWYTIQGINNMVQSQKEDSKALAPSGPPIPSDRAKVRMQSFIDMRIFKERWRNAVKEDNCWVDPY